MIQKGHLHPLTQIIRRSIMIFNELGYEIVEGPEVTTEHFCFNVLNIPKWHPGRDLQDTFWLPKKRLPRTHTSAMQIPAMKTRKPPVRIVIPGRIFRNERTDSTHEHTITQLEGFVIDKNIKLTHLISTLNYFYKKLFGTQVTTRIIPNYYPYTEPSLDVAVYYKNKWMELLGSGMIHPKVLKNMGIDSKKFSGFAFGMGMERLSMTINKINDVRLFHSGDLRLINQF